MTLLSKAIADAHTTAIAEAMEYLTAHAGYTRIHNPRTGEKDLVRLPGLAAIAYQHETSRCGDPHLHTHVIVPNRQARADGAMVSIDGTSLYHEARAAGVIYQATLRRELHHSLGLEWAPVDPSTGMAELAGVDRDTITAWSRRSTQLREWAAHNLHVVDDPLTAAQLAAAQKATRPAKPEELAWAQLVEQWRADARGLHLDRAAFDAARAARRTAARTPFDTRAHPGARPRRSTRPRSPAPTSSRSSARSYPWTPSAPRASCSNPPSTRLRCGSPRPGPRISARATSASPSTPSSTKKPRCSIWSTRATTAPCCGSKTTTPRTCRRIRSAPCENIGRSPWLVQPLSAPAGAGKTTSMRALRAAAHRRFDGTVLVLAPTGKAVDVAVREGAGDHGYTIAKALQLLRDNQLDARPAHPGRRR